MLTDPEIELVVALHRLQLPRFEDAARVVERRSRTALDRWSVPALTSSRAKSSRSLRERLRRRRDDPELDLSNLQTQLDHIVGDLAGCRVLVYRPEDVDRAHRSLRAFFPLAGIRNDEQVHDRPSGYRAVHLLVRPGSGEERESIRDTVCELQIVTLAAHVFNELEHHARYKRPSDPLAAEFSAALDGLLGEARELDAAARRLVGRAGALLASDQGAVRDGFELAIVLEAALGRPVHGEFAMAFAFAMAAVPARAEVVFHESGGVAAEFRRGETLALELGIAQADDATCILLPLVQRFPLEFMKFLGRQRRPSGMLDLGRKLAMARWDSR